MNHTPTPATTHSGRIIPPVIRRKYAARPDKPYPSGRCGDQSGAARCRTGWLMTVFGYTVLCLFHSLAHAEYGIQVGAFANQANAIRLADSINEQGFKAIMVPVVDRPVTLTRVIIGPYANTTSARSAQRQLAGHQWAGMIINYPDGTDDSEPHATDDSPSLTDEVTADVWRADSVADTEELIVAGLIDATPAGNHHLTMDDTSETLVIGESPGDSLPDDDTLIIDDGDQPDDDSLIIDEATSDGEELFITEPETGPQPGDDSLEPTGGWTDRLRYRQDDFSIGLDQLRIEYGNLYKSDATADTSNYGHVALSANWKPTSRWETQVSGRLDWYYQSGDPQVDEKALDYGESFVRFRGDQYRLTAGTQKIIWGRIDEVPPTDRMSRVDAARGVLGPLAERRRALPALRLEGFHQGFKLDAVLLADFRKAFLADKDSVWYTINRTQGAILGFETTPLVETLVKNGSITENAPSGIGGYGVRMSNTGAHFDYAVTVQRNRQSLPYWQLNPEVRGALLGGADPITAIASSSDATFRARYPRAWVVGGDLGFEALDGTWRFEAAWISDTPVTRTDLRFDKVDSANWAAGFQFFPGDSEFRVNLQIVGTNMIDTPSVLDNENTYNFNGTVHGEFGKNRWRMDTRFFFGLDRRDIYINPEITFIGWEPHEIYAAWHYFDGDDETIGGYWEDSALLTLGVRTQF